jgi:hypothetical protein
MQIGGEGVEILLMNMVLEKNTLKKQKLEKTPFHAFLHGNGVNRF